MGGADGKEYPIKRKDMLKAHARFRDYVYEKISVLDFGKSVEDLIRKDLVLKSHRNYPPKKEEKGVPTAFQM